jgi:hypothetical protein
MPLVDRVMIRVTDDLDGSGFLFEIKFEGIVEIA